MAAVLPVPEAPGPRFPEVLAPGGRAPGALFVTLEGIDGTGKSTQARLLAEALRRAGREVVETREPGGAPGAEQIRALLVTGEPGRWSPTAEALLFTAARRDHVERLVAPALARGLVVVCDRYLDSTRAYQGAAAPGEAAGPGAPAGPREAVEALHALAIGLMPDLTLVLDMPAAEAAARARARAAAATPLPGGPLMAPPEPYPDPHAGPRRGPAPGADRGGHPGARPPVHPGAHPEAHPDRHAAARAGLPEDRFERRGEAFQSRLRDAFLALAAADPARLRVIDATGGTATVAARIWAEVAPLATGRPAP